MKRLVNYILAVVNIPVLLLSCEVLDNDPDIHVKDDTDSLKISLNEVALLLSSLSINTAQLHEVHDAVTSSSENGYDEEYTMKRIFSAPGTGVGDEFGGAVAAEPAVRSSSAEYMTLRDLIGQYVRSSLMVKGSGDAWWSKMDADEYLEALEESGLQIYWPYSERWDGAGMPVITFDPGYYTEVNIGYEVSVSDDGSRIMREVEVSEEMARERPVWVVNRNEDADYLSLEALRKLNPEWGEGGGTIIVKPSDADVQTKSRSPLRTLMLKDFTMNRNYDSWFAGASELIRQSRFGRGFHRVHRGGT